jgi:hypothetical protein
MSNSKHSSGGRAYCIYLNDEDRVRLRELSHSCGGSGSLVIRAALQLASESGKFSETFENTFRRVYLRGV